MELAGPLGTPLGLAQRKRASPRGEEGSPGFLSISDSDRRVPAELGRECSPFSLKIWAMQTLPSSPECLVGNSTGILRPSCVSGRLQCLFISEMHLSESFQEAQPPNERMSRSREGSKDIQSKDRSLSYRRAITWCKAMSGWTASQSMAPRRSGWGCRGGAGNFQGVAAFASPRDKD